MKSSRLSLQANSKAGLGLQMSQTGLRLVLHRAPMREGLLLPLVIYPSAGSRSVTSQLSMKLQKEMHPSSSARSSLASGIATCHLGVYRWHHLLLLVTGLGYIYLASWLAPLWPCRVHPPSTGPATGLSWMLSAGRNPSQNWAKNRVESNSQNRPKVGQKVADFYSKIYEFLAQVSRPRHH